MIFHSRESGYQVVFSEGGSDATHDLSFYRANTGGSGATIISDSANFMTGSRSIKTTIDSASDFAYLIVEFPDGPSALPGPGMRTSFYVRFSAYPSAAAGISAQFFEPAEGGQDTKLTIDNFGVLRLVLYDGIAPFFVSQIGSDGPTLLLDTWYRISYTRRVFGRLANDFRVYVDGVLAIDVKNHTGFPVPSGSSTGFLSAIRRVSFGFFTFYGGSLSSINFDDIYIDNSDSLEDPGDIRVINKKPNSNSTNNFPVAIGSNPASRWVNVDEQPISTANGWLQNSGSVLTQENYGIESESSGDFDLTGYSGVYPVSPATGVDTRWSGGLYLYDCGVYFTINSDDLTIVDQKPWAYISTSFGTVNSLNRVGIYSNGSSISLNGIQITGDASNPYNSQGQTLNTTPGVFFRYFDTANVLKPMRFHSISNAKPFIFNSRN